VNERTSTFVIIVEPGEEAMSTLVAFARDQALGASQVTALGAFERVVLSYFDRERPDYERIPIERQVEVLSLPERRQRPWWPPAGSDRVADARDVITETPICLRRRFDPTSCGGRQRA
jgi:hypothetical protein